MNNRICLFFWLNPEQTDPKPALMWKKPPPCRCVFTETPGCCSVKRAAVNVHPCIRLMQHMRKWVHRGPVWQKLYTFPGHVLYSRGGALATVTEQLLVGCTKSVENGGRLHVSAVLTVIESKPNTPGFLENYSIFRETFEVYILYIYGESNKTSKIFLMDVLTPFSFDCRRFWN